MYFTTHFDVYRNNFLKKYGSVKLSKIEQKIYNSKSLKNLFQKSKSFGIAPTEADFSASIHNIIYFITAGGETTAMGVLTAINYWNQTINQGEIICSENELYSKYLATLKRYQINFN